MSYEFKKKTRPKQPASEVKWMFPGIEYIETLLNGIMLWLSEEMVSRDDVLSALDETGLITPVASVENVVYSDETGKIFVL